LDREVAELKLKLHTRNAAKPMVCPTCGEPLYKHIVPCVPNTDSKSQEELRLEWEATHPRTQHKNLGPNEVKA